MITHIEFPRRALLSLPLMTLLAAHAPRPARGFAPDMRAFVARARDILGAPAGLSIAVTRRAGPLLVDGAGFGDLERGLAATPDTRFYIASSTKSFVGTALAILAARGRIDLAWTLATLAPDLTFATGVRADEVTLRHLLSHSHGLRNDAIQFRLAYSGEHDPATLWAALGRVEANPRAPLGTFAYSNLGYNIATLLIERRLGIGWQAMLEQEVLRPLGLSATAARGLDRPARRALPYAGRERLYLVKTDRTMQSAGGMESTARDMIRWLRLNLAAEAGVATALPALAVRDTHRPVVTLESSFGPFARRGYGLGWYSGPYREHALYHAFGGFVGFRAHVSFVPSLDLGVAVLSNEDGDASQLVDIVAAYAYDWHLIGPKAALTEADKRLAALRAEIAKAKPLAAPTAPVLSVPLAAATGRFCNRDWGTMVLADEGGALSLSIGALHARATAGDAPDRMRAALIPGQPMTFALEVRDGRVEAIKAFGARFERC